jgi:hypothetical protein
MTCYVCQATMLCLQADGIAVAQCPVCGTTETLGPFARQSDSDYTAQLRQSDQLKQQTQGQDNEQRQAS